MRAIVVREYGGPEVLRLEELPDPVPGPGELLVRVAAAGVQFIETVTRTGTLGGISPAAPRELPWIPGREVAGEVTALGEGVDAGWLGARVTGVTPGISGGYASLGLVEAASAHLLPDGLAFPEAVSLLGTGGTALGLVEAAGIGEGDTVLIESAAGAVGLLSAQLARAAGAARVIGLAGGPEKVALVKEFGADAAIDYTDEDWPEQVRAAAPDGVTVVFDGNGGEVGAHAFALLARGGRFVVFGFSSGQATQLDQDLVAARGIKVLSFFGPPTGPRSPGERRRQTADVIAAVAGGRLRPHVGQRFPLARAAEAHAAIASRSTVGKTVLEP